MGASASRSVRAIGIEEQGQWSTPAVSHHGLRVLSGREGAALAQQLKYHLGLGGEKRRNGNSKGEDKLPSLHVSEGNGSVIYFIY